MTSPPKVWPTLAQLFPREPRAEAADGPAARPVWVAGSLQERIHVNLGARVAPAERHRSAALGRL
jgi:hypothetical protein